MERFSIILALNPEGIKNYFRNQKLDFYFIFKIKLFRYYEMREKDVVKFGYSTREYVLLHEKTDTSEVHESSSEDEPSESEDEEK